MNSVVLFSSGIPANGLTEVIGRCHLKISKILIADNDRVLFDQSKLKHSLVLLDSELPMMLLYDLRKADANIILYTSNKHTFKFTTLIGLFDQSSESEMVRILNDLNQTDKHEEFSEMPANLKTSKISLNTSHEIVFIDPKHIRYFEAQSNYTNIYTDLGKRYTSSRNIGFYEKLVSSADFFRCHNSYLVNLSKVTKFIKGHLASIEIDHESIIEVSTRKKDKMLQLLGVSHHI